MKRILVPVVASLMLLGCGAPKQSDTALIADFYAHILSNKPVEDAYIESVLSKELLATLWEADYIDTYSYWVFRTGAQDGPSSESGVKAIEPLGEGWYRVIYSDMGHSGITDIQVKDGKICAYKPGLEEDTYLTAIGRYMKELGSHYTPAEHCIPFNLIVDADASNPDDIRVWGDFWVENYNQSADTLLAVSGGSYPGCMHVKKTTSGFEVSQFEAVEDGSSFTRTAKAIFGDRYATDTNRSWPLCPTTRPESVPASSPSGTMQSPPGSKSPATRMKAGRPCPSSSNWPPSNWKAAALLSC